MHLNHPKFKKINDLYTDDKYKIFHSLYKMYSAVLPWNQHPILKDLTPELLDVMYRYHSGLKTIHYPIASDIEKYDSADYAAYYIYSMLASNWKKDFEVLFADFDFLDNVDIATDEEKIGEDFHIFDTDENDSYKLVNNDTKNTKDNIISDSNTKFKSETLNNEHNVESGVSSSENKREDNSYTDDSIFTFNAPIKSIETSEGIKNIELPTNDSQSMVSNNGVDSSIKSDNTETEKNNITNVDNITSDESSTNSNSNEVRNISETKENTVVKHTKDSNSNKENNNIHNKGRNGRFTPQKMSIEQLDLNKNIFFERVFNSIDKLICIPCY